MTSAPGPGKLIMLIEDNPDDEALTLLALQKANIDHKLVVARDGVQALEHLLGTGRPAAELPALILLDLKLPKWDGLQVLRRLRSDPRTRLVPVVMLTSSVVEADVTQSYASGANSYLRKPVNFDVFVELMRQVSRYWLTLNIAPPRRPLADREWTGP